jgi:hypothetical protein
VLSAVLSALPPFTLSARVAATTTAPTTSHVSKVVELSTCLSDRAPEGDVAVSVVSVGQGIISHHPLLSLEVMVLQRLRGGSSLCWLRVKLQLTAISAMLCTRSEYPSAAM